MWYRNLNKMKELKFKTSKGEFLVVDNIGEVRVNNAKAMYKLSEITDI